MNRSTFNLKNTVLFIFAVYLIAVIPIYFSTAHFPLPEFWPKIISISQFLFLALSLVTLGNLALKAFGAPPIDSPWKFLLCYGLGFGIFAFLVFGVGYALPGSLSQKLILLFFLNIVLFIYGLFRHKVEFKKSLKSFNLKLNGLQMTCLFLSLIGITLSFIACFSPITYYDSLVYHLGLPHLYIQNQSIDVIPFNLYSFFPAHTEMIFLYILDRFFYPEYVINLITWFFSLSISLGIFSLCKSIKGENAGFVGLALWWTFPSVLFLSTGAYIDIPLAFFIFLSLTAFIQFSKDLNKSFWLVMAGIFSGMACATKYTGLMCPIILTIFIFTLHLTAKKNIKNFTVFSIATLIPFLPWLIKNFLAVGNPVFPFFHNILGQHAGWAPETANAYFRLLTEYGDKSQMISDLMDILLRPWNIVKKFGGGMDVLGTIGWWPLIIIGAPIGYMVSEKDQKLWFIGLYALLHFGLWFLTKPVLRFLMGLLPIAIILSSLGLTYFLTHKKKSIAQMAICIISPWLLSHFFLFFFVSKSFEPFSVPFGIETRHEFLNRKLSFYSVFNYANNNLDPLNRIYIMGEQRGYHLKIPFMTSNYFAKEPLATIANTANDEKPLMAFLIDHGISHIIINEKELNRLGGLSVFGFSDRGSKMFIGLMEKITFVTSQNGTSLYSLK